MTDYILFLGQQGNFQTRSMLIPAKEFLEARNEDYQLLKKSSKKFTFIIDNIKHEVDNLLLQNIVWNGNYGTSETHQYSDICHKLTCYADGLDDDQYYDLKDKEWYDKTPTNLCGGFNHIKNYTELKNLKKHKDQNINIIDSFLVLELRNGILEMPSCDTVEEMYNKFYPLQ